MSKAVAIAVCVLSAFFLAKKLYFDPIKREEQRNKKQIKYQKEKIHKQK